jgi:hypothetical protein
VSQQPHCAYLPPPSVPAAAAIKTLTAGERTGIFTPMLFVKARKPGSASDRDDTVTDDSNESTPRRRNGHGTSGARPGSAGRSAGRRY